MHRMCALGLGAYLAAAGCTRVTAPTVEVDAQADDVVVRNGDDAIKIATERAVVEGATQPVMVFGTRCRDTWRMLCAVDPLKRSNGAAARQGFPFDIPGNITVSPNGDCKICSIDGSPATAIIRVQGWDRDIALTENAVALYAKSVFINEEIIRGVVYSEVTEVAAGRWLVLIIPFPGDRQISLETDKGLNAKLYLVDHNGECTPITTISRRKEKGTGE